MDPARLARPRAAPGGGIPRPPPRKRHRRAPTHRLGRGDPGERRRLGDSDLRVSLACLDASTWTKCGDETQAHAQLSLAVDNGVNLVHLGSADASRRERVVVVILGDDIRAHQGPRGCVHGQLAQAQP